MEPSPYRLALAQNVATNGRLFCCLLAFANYAVGVHPIIIALLSVPVGFAWVSDLVPNPRAKGVLAVASIASAVLLSIATLVNCW